MSREIIPTSSFIPPSASRRPIAVPTTIKSRPSVTNDDSVDCAKHPVPRARQSRVAGSPTAPANTEQKKTENLYCHTQSTQFTATKLDDTGTRSRQYYATLRIRPTSNSALTVHARRISHNSSRATQPIQHSLSTSSEGDEPPQPHN